VLLIENPATGWVSEGVDFSRKQKSGKYDKFEKEIEGMFSE
jgi:hypothetical protein